MHWLHTPAHQADLDAIAHAALNDPGNFEYIHTTEESGAHIAVQTTYMRFQGNALLPTPSLQSVLLGTQIQLGPM